MSKKTVTLKSTYFTPMTDAEIIKAVESKRKGVFRKVTWLTDIVDIGAGRDEITIEKTMFVRLNINYNHMKSVIERKAKEDAALGITGVPKPRRDSSYCRLTDADGNLAEPPYILRDKTTQTRKFLQCLVTNVKDIRTKRSRPVVEKFYKNGVEINPDDNKMLMTLIAALRHPAKEHKDDEPFDTFVLPFEKIKEII